MVKCNNCDNNAVIRHFFSKAPFCASCFQDNFENEVHSYIIENKLITPNSTIVVGVSGGKDSSVLLTVLHKIIYSKFPSQYSNVSLTMCAVDEGIVGYRKKSLDVVNKLQKMYDLPLTVIDFQSRFGRTLDKLVSELHLKKATAQQDIEDSATNTALACSYCGILRRNSLNIGASMNGDNAIVATGHNADDYAETVLLNLIRGDFSKLKRCVDPIADLGIGNAKIKPFAHQAQKDIVMYAHYAKVPYFSTECPYAVTAYRGVARRYIQKMQAKHPRTALNIQNSVKQLKRGSMQNVKVSLCYVCGNPITSSNCQVCQIKVATTTEELQKVLKVKARY